MASDQSKLIGRTFGRWTVIGIASREYRTNPSVQCRCSCGLVVNVSATNLYNGKSTKCVACAREESARKYRERAAAGQVAS